MAILLLEVWKALASLELTYDTVPSNALHQERRLDTQKVFLYKESLGKTPRTAFAGACRRAGITGLRLHDPRQTASTNLRQAGVDTMTARG